MGGRMKRTRIALGDGRDAALGAALRAAVGNLAGEGTPRASEAGALELAADASRRREVRIRRMPGTRALAAAALAVVAAGALGVSALAARRRALDAGFEAALSILPEASTWVAEVFAAEFRPEGAVDEFVAGLWSPDSGL